MIEFLHLGALEGVGVGFEVGAGVDHALVEPQPVEGVGDVVVVLDIGHVATALVPPVQQPRPGTLPAVGDAPNQRLGDGKHAPRAAAEVDIVVNIGSGKAPQLGRASDSHRRSVRVLSCVVTLPAVSLLSRYVPRIST